MWENVTFAAGTFKVEALGNKVMTREVKTAGTPAQNTFGFFKIINIFMRYFFTNSVNIHRTLFNSFICL